MEKTSNADLSKMPEDMCLEIIEKFETKDDTRRVRAVCNNFRSYIPAPVSLFPHTVLKIPLPDGPSPDYISKYSLKQSTAYAIQPLGEASDPSGQPKTWIVKVQEIMDSGGRKSCRIRLMDPTCPLAVYENVAEKLPKPFSLLDYRVRKLARAYEVEFDVGEGIVFLLSGDLDVMAFYKGRKLAVLRREENSWTQLENLGVESVKHMICYDRKFYVVDKKGSTVSVDCKSLKVKKILESPRIILGTGSKYLVESEENLYLLVEYCRCNNLPHKQKPINHPVVFDFFKLDEGRKQWVPLIEGVDDRVFFLSGYCSYSLSADEFPGIKRNSVYFTGSSDTTYVKDPCHPGSVSVVFDIDKDKSRPLSYHDSCYSKLFWPPPPWLNWSTSKSS